MKNTLLVTVFFFIFSNVSFAATVNTDMPQNTLVRLAQKETTATEKRAKRRKAQRRKRARANRKRKIEEAKRARRARRAPTKRRRSTPLPPRRETQAPPQIAPSELSAQAQTQAQAQAQAHEQSASPHLKTSDARSSADLNQENTTLQSARNSPQSLSGVPVDRETNQASQVTQSFSNAKPSSKAVAVVSAISVVAGAAGGGAAWIFTEAKSRDRVLGAIVGSGIMLGVPLVSVGITSLIVGVNPMMTMTLTAVGLIGGTLGGAVAFGIAGLLVGGAIGLIVYANAAAQGELNQPGLASETIALFLPFILTIYGAAAGAVVGAIGGAGAAPFAYANRDIE